MTPAYLERECVVWCYGKKYIKRESVERYCERYGERKNVIEIFKVNRKYRELVERLGVEMVDDYSKYLPCSKIEITIIIDDESNDNNHLPWEVTGVVVENYDDDYMTNKIITCLLYTSRCV